MLKHDEHNPPSANTAFLQPHLLHPEYLTFVHSRQRPISWLRLWIKFPPHRLHTLYMTIYYSKLHIPFQFFILVAAKANESQHNYFLMLQQPS